MANKKISELTQISTIDKTNDFIPIVDASDTETKKVSVEQLTSDKSNRAANQRSGTALAFDDDSVYGTVASPESGNITANLTGAVLSGTALLLHNSDPAPTFGANFNLISGTYDTTAGVINRILCVYLDDNNIDYLISQPQ